MENLTIAEIKQLIADALATAMDTPDNNKISALDLRGVLNTMTEFMAQTEAMQETIMAAATQALELAQANVLKNTAQDSSIENATTIATGADTLSKMNELRIEAIEAGGGSGSQTEEQIRLANEARQANTEARIAQVMKNTEFTDAIADLVRTQGLQDIAIQTAQTRADDAYTLANRADGKADDNAEVNAGLRTDVDTLKNAEPVDSLTDTEKENLAKIPNIVEQIGTDGAVGEQGTGLKGDVKALKATDDDIKARLDEIGEGTSDISDFLVAHGETPAFTPGIAYRGTGDQDFYDNNQATIPGLILNQATGDFRIPAVSLTSDDGTALPAGTRFNLANAYLNPGLTGRTVGFNPIFYTQITQGTNVLLGAGIAGDVTNLARDWVAADSVDSFTVLNARGAITGTTTDEDILVRWVAVYNGEDATLVPSLSAFAISFAGQYEGAIEHIVHNVVDGDVASLKDRDRLLEGGIAANAVGVNRVDGKADSNTARVDLIETKLAKPSFEAINEATVVPVDSETIEPTALNNDLGTGGQPFAKLLDGAVDSATKFITAFNSRTQFLQYGTGQIARVTDGSLIVYRVVEARDSETNTEVKYITTRSGLGTRTSPAVLEFGVDVPGQVARSAQDSEIYLDTGIPDQVLPDGTTISNVSMAFGIRTNNNWNSIAQELVFNIRSGQTRTFAIPSPIVEMTFTATALPGGRIRCRATHNRGVGNSQDVVTNGGAIRFDAGYTETVITPAVDRGQEAINLGPYTGTEVIAINAGQAGDSDTETVKVIIATRTDNLPTVFDTGYFLREANRLGIATSNPSYTFYESEPNTTISPEVVAQLDGADNYLGLYARTNHHGDSLQLANSLIVPTTDGSRLVTVADAVVALENNAGTTGDGLSTSQVRDIADQQINTSPAIQANTAKPTEAVIDQKIETAVNEISLTPGPQGIQGEKGETGDQGPKGDNGTDGVNGTNGTNGSDGVDGARGLQGIPGTNGMDGEDGSDGEQGEQGIPGNDGATGPAGAKGDKGDTGATGAQGLRGTMGEKGDTGDRGTDGTNGVDGAQGIPGTNGTDGRDGAMGIQGEQGEQGIPGTAGADGATGEKGDQGIQGIQGLMGETGPTGAMGAQGLRGEKGETGEQGIQGIQGIPGVSGDGSGGTILPTTAFLARGDSSASDTQNGTWSTIALATPTLNEGNHFNNGIYTAPETGIYWFNTRVSVISGGNNTITNIGLSINGANPLAENQVEGVHSSGTRAPIAEWNGAVSLTKGDTVEMQSMGSVATIINSASLFSGFAVPTAQQGLPGEAGAQGVKGEQGERGLTGNDGQDGAVGAQGPMGLQGEQGNPGQRGAMGLQGESGAQGEQGIAGVQGEMGLQGIPGEHGTDGSMGLQGLRGERGEKGDTGNDGAPGNDGMDGAPGPQGAIGETGPRGERGLQGEMGVMGTQGSTGEQGIQGNVGPKGDKGDAGSDGQDGAIGPMGEQGIQGIQGIQGDKGDKGDTGERGLKGDPGTAANTLSEARAREIADGQIVESLEPSGSIRNALDALGATGAQAEDIQEGGSMELSLDGTETGNFLINLPTDSLTQDSQFDGNLIISSTGGSAPDSFTYSVRYTDGDRATIFGNTTISAVDAANGFALGPYDIEANRPTEISIGANGGVGNTLSWTLSATVGSGKDGVLVPGAIALIEKYAPAGEVGPQGEMGIPGRDGQDGADGLNGADSTVPGPQGPTGQQGVQGVPGNIGVQGEKGDPGEDGSDGLPGPQGIQGQDGARGATGPRGLKGDMGDMGVQGERGLTGLTGAQGEQGVPGPTGATGSQGIQGERGTNGTNGVDGSDGATGAQGPKGDTGATGLTGPQGPAGENGMDGVNGVDGAIGPQGVMGLKGDKGDRGEPGPVGDGGTEGVIGPKGDQGEQGIQGPQGLQGERGEIGPQGETGATGQTGAMGLPGRDGTDGSAGARGERGLKGDTGPIGPQGEAGVQGETGLQGIRGLTGTTGSQGPRGLTGLTGADGQDSTVPGPRGEKGETGDIGPRGFQGETGLQGIRGLTGETGPISTVPGPRGLQGERGIQGITGSSGSIGPAGPRGLQGSINYNDIIEEINATSPANDFPTNSAYFSIGFASGNRLTTAIFPTTVRNGNTFNPLSLRGEFYTFTYSLLESRAESIAPHTFTVVIRYADTGAEISRRTYINHDTSTQARTPIETIPNVEGGRTLVADLTVANRTDALAFSFTNDTRFFKSLSPNSALNRAIRAISSTSLSAFSVVGLINENLGHNNWFTPTWSTGASLNAYDTGDDEVGGVFTAPVDGIYNFTVKVITRTTGGQVSNMFAGVGVGTVPTVANYVVVGVATGIDRVTAYWNGNIRMTAGQTARAYYFIQSTGTNSTSNTPPTFTGNLLTTI